MVTCFEEGRVAQISSATSTPTVGFVVFLKSAIRVAMRGRRLERALLLLVVSFFCGASSALAVGLVVVLNSVIHVAVRGRLVERAPLVLVVSLFPRLFTDRLYATRRLLIVLRLSALPPSIGPMPLLL